MEPLAKMSHQIARLGDVLIARIDSLERLTMNQALALAALQAAVAAEDSVIASAITLINGIAARIAAAGTDADALAALTADIQAQSATLAAAVQANQAPAPAAPPAPAETPAPAADTSAASVDAPGAGAGDPSALPVGITVDPAALG